MRITVALSEASRLTSESATGASTRASGDRAPGAGVAEVFEDGSSPREAISGRADWIPPRPVGAPRSTTATNTAAAVVATPAQEANSHCSVLEVPGRTGLRYPVLLLAETFA